MTRKRVLGTAMGLFGKDKSETPSIDSRERAQALIIMADAPPQGAPSRGRYSQGTVKASVPDRFGRRHTLESAFKYADDRWLVPGMDATVFVDPAQADTFEVDWSSVPPMKQQADANHPALADPFAASRRIAKTLDITPSEKTASQYERFQQAVTEASGKAAPAGQRRAVALIATVRGRFDSGASGDSGDGSSGGASRPSVILTRNSEAVLSVAVPGQTPYAVFVPKFKIPSKHLSIPGEPMPAYVSATDPQQVDIIWDEAPGLMDQVAARMADSSRASSKVQAGMTEHYEAAIQQAMANPAAAAMGAPMGMPPAARQMLIDNLKRSLTYVTDPAQRQVMLDQYRTMGLDITPEELGL